MASIRSKAGALFNLAAANDLDGVQDETKTLDLTGSQGAVIIAQNSGTDGTAGIDVIVFSRDGGNSYRLLTAANVGQGHGGLRDSAGAAVAGAALNAAGAEVNAAFIIPPPDGQFRIKLNRKTGEFGTTWVTGAPAVQAIRLG